MWNVKPASASGHAQPPLSPIPIASQGVEERRVVAWIGPSVTLKGELISSEDMQIEGHVKGTIELRHHDLILGTNADVQADIIAKTISIRGTVAGTVMAGEKIDISETAFVTGDLTAPRLAMAEGATVQGRVATSPKQIDGDAEILMSRLVSDAQLGRSALSPN